MAYFGIDLGTSSIKVVQAELMGTRSYRVSGVGLVQNPAGVVAFDDPRVSGKLAQAIKQVITQAGIHDKRAVVAIPELKCYSRIVEMPNMSEAELATAVKWEAEQFVPIPVAEVELDYVVVRRPPKGSEQKMLVYLVAAPKKYLQAMVDFLLSLGIEPVAVESEMVAVARIFTMVGLPGTSMIVHIGAQSSVMAVVEGESLLFTHASSVGGVAMSRAISESLKLPAAQAEEYKRVYGLDGAQLEGKVREALLLVCESLVGDLRKAVEHSATKYATNVVRIILSGGGAYLPAFAQQLSSVFGGLEVVLGDPFVNAKPARGVTIPNERTVYSVAAGLAVRSF